MEKRVKALEDDMKRVLQDTAEIKCMLRAAPSAIEFGELKGRVNSLPTMGKAAAMLSIVWSERLRQGGALGLVAMALAGLGYQPMAIKNGMNSTFEGMRMSRASLRTRSS
jgi:hypothetical protein